MQSLKNYPKYQANLFTNKHFWNMERRYCQISRERIFTPNSPKDVAHNSKTGKNENYNFSASMENTVRVQDMTNWGKIWSWLLYHKRHPQQFQTVNHSADQSCGHGMEEISNTQSNTDPKQNKSLSFCPPRSQLTLPHSHYPVIFSTFYSTEHLLSLLPNTLENNYF